MGRSWGLSWAILGPYWGRLGALCFLSSRFGFESPRNRNRVLAACGPNALGHAIKRLERRLCDSVTCNQTSNTSKEDSAACMWARHWPAITNYELAIAQFKGSTWTDYQLQALLGCIVAGCHCVAVGQHRHPNRSVHWPSEKPHHCCVDPDHHVMVID